MCRDNIKVCYWKQGFTITKRSKENTKTTSNRPLKLCKEVYFSFTHFDLLVQILLLMVLIVFPDC